MIVRIMGEGQYQVTDDVIDKINEVDNRLVEIVQGEDERLFSLVFGELLDSIRTACRPISIDELVESDVVLPPGDMTLDEAREIFKGEGILPG